MASAEVIQNFDDDKDDEDGSVDADFDGCDDFLDSEDDEEDDEDYLDDDETEDTEGAEDTEGTDDSEDMVHQLYQTEPSVKRKRSPRLSPMPILAPIKGLKYALRPRQSAKRFAKLKRRKLMYLPLPFKITSWKSLLALADAAANLPDHTFYRDGRKLVALLPHLKEIDQLVGLEQVKETLVDIILHHLQQAPDTKSDMRHMVICGPAGVGKTTLARCMAKLFNAMGLTRSGELVIGTRSNMVGKFIGQTAPKTNKIIDSALGGTLLIDEAYQLQIKSDGDDNDTYGTECINTLNQRLSEDGDKFICILAGYKDQIEKSVFSVNDGLSRRFQWYIQIHDPGPKALHAIFLQKLNAAHLALDKNTLVNEAWFAARKDKFKHFGGSIENLVAKLKIVQARRVFGEPRALKGQVVQADVDRAMHLYTTFEHAQQVKDHDKGLIKSMYL